MVEINITTDKETFSPEKLKKYNNAYKDAYPNDENIETGIKLTDKQASLDDIEIEEDTFNLYIDSKELGYITLAVELKNNPEFLMKTIELVVKKLNKFKTILEAL